MRIASIIDISLVDVPGVPVTVIFTGGCNFDCPYCQNAELIPIESGEVMRIDEIVYKVGGFLTDGFCITGGEPTIHGDLPDLLKALKATGTSHINLNTQGSVPTTLKKCIPFLDSVWFDLKASPSRYDEVTNLRGTPWFKVVESFTLVLGSGVALWPRTTYVGGLMTQSDILDIMSFLVSADYKGDYTVQNYVESKGVREALRCVCTSPDFSEVESLFNRVPKGINLRFEWR